MATSSTSTILPVVPISKSALELVNTAIAELEARLNFPPQEDVIIVKEQQQQQQSKISQQSKNNEKKKLEKNNTTAVAAAVTNDDIPDICKLEFKVGVITKVWVHESADKLYCEEIDVGEEDGPRQIASGLRPHFTIEQMLGQRLIVVSNLKAKNLVGFKSHGMVLCAAGVVVTNTNDDSSVTESPEIVEFVEPPIDAMIGEIITFDGLPLPTPLAPNVIEKKKVFATAALGMNTDADGIANWNGHSFMTSTGPCRTRTLTNSVLR